MFFANRVPPKARDAYRLDAMSGMLGAVMMGLTGPFVGVIARKTLNASAFEIAVLSMAPVAGNLFSLVWANAMEGRRKMPFALWSWVAARSLFFLVLFATTSTRFVIIVSAINFVATIASPAYSAIMKEVYPDSERASIMGYARVCTIGVYVVITAVAGSLVSGQGYRYIFPIAGLFGIISTFVFSRIRSDDTSGDPTIPMHRFIHNSFMILRDDPGFRWFCGGIFVFGFANFMAQPLYTIYQVKIGVDTRWAGIYSMISASVMTVSYLYWGSYIDRRRPERVIAMQAAMWALVPIIYCVATRPWMLISTMLLGGVLNSGFELSYFTGVLHFAPRERITHYQGVFLSLMGIRGIVAPFVGAALAGDPGSNPGLISMKALFLISAAMVLASAGMQVIGMKRHPSKDPARAR